MRLTWRDVELVPGKPPIFTSLTEAETAELQRLVRGVPQLRVLEIGSAFGYSTCAMGIAGDDIDITTIDPHQTHNSLGHLAANIQDFGLEERVKVCVGSSQTVLPDLLRGYYNVVFIDGDHTPEGVWHDLMWARQLVKPFGAAIACHDYDEDTCPGVKIAIDAMAKDWRMPNYFVDTLAVYSDPRWP